MAKMYLHSTPSGISIPKMVQSWIFVPAGVVKPYATTIISHLVTMVAMFGMHWVAFDQASRNVIAQGSA